MAATSCGTEADIFGSLITLAFGLRTISPSSMSPSSCFWSSFKFLTKVALILPAREISLLQTLIPANAAKDRTIGSKEALASSGASSTIVYNMSGLELFDI